MRRPAKIMAATTAVSVASTLALVGIAQSAGANDARERQSTKAQQLAVSSMASGLTALDPTDIGDGDSGFRLAGDDRFETAVEISSFWYSAPEGETYDPELDGPFITYLANGLAFPDALAAGSVDFALGPLLLAAPTDLPDVTAAEINRLKPCFVIVVGGTTAVNDAVAAEAEALADSTQDKCGAA